MQRPFLPRLLPPFSLLPFFILPPSFFSFPCYCSLLSSINQLTFIILQLATLLFSLHLSLSTVSAAMADRTEIRDRPHHQLQVHPQHPAYKGRSTGPTTSQIIALITLVPVSGTLLCLAGLTLVGSVIGLAITTPIFILFSPVLVPAAILIGLAVTGFLSSGAFGLTGLSSLSRVVGYLRQVGRRMPDELDCAKRRMADVAAFAGQKTKDVGQTIESKARESGTGART